MAELSAGPVSATALLNPQCQREIIKQAADMTTRQVAGLLATAAPEMVPPRDTLRAVASDRFTLKVSIDRECEQGLRQLKGLRSHLDPRMSWGDLVALLVREAVARHDPRGGGRRPGRAGRTAASSRRGRSRTPAVVPAAARAGGDDGDTPAPQGKTAAAREQPRAAVSPNAAPGRRSARTAPAIGATPAGGVAPGVCAGATASATPAAAAAPEGQSAGARVTCPAPRAPAPDAPRVTAPVAPLGGARQAGPSSAPQAAAAPKFASGGSADGSVAVPFPQSAPPAPKSARRGAPDGSGAAPVPPDTPPAPRFSSGGTVDGTDVPPVSSCAAPAPKFACGDAADGPGAALIPPDANPAPKFAGGGTAEGSSGARVSPDAAPAPQLAGGVPPARGAGGARTGASPQATGGAPRGPRRPPVRLPIPAAVRRHVRLRDGGRCCYRDPLTGRRCNSSHLLQIDHLLPVAEGGGPEPFNLALSCFVHHRMRHGYGPALPSEPSR